MRTMYLTKGLPASGKSTWAKAFIKKEPGRWKRINCDDLRSMFDDYVFSPENEEFVTIAQNSLIKSALNEGYDIVVDNTNLNMQALNKLHKIAESIGDITVIEKSFNVSVDECIKRNESREGHAKIPTDVIMRMAKSSGIAKGHKLKDAHVYYPPLNQRVYTRDNSLRKAIICDLDGTLALMGDRSPYDASKCDELDSPNEPVVECVEAMFLQGYKIIFVSGRESRFKIPTERFIKACLPNITYELHMRNTADNRKDSIVKEEIFSEHIDGKYDVLFVLDDRDSVCQTWRLMGLSCFQVAEGNF